MTRDEKPAAVPWLAWLAWTGLAAALVALGDLMLCTLALPATASSAGAALQTWALTCGTFCLVGWPLSVGLALLDRPAVHARIPGSSALATGVVLGAVGATAVFALESRLAGATDEFTAEPGRARWVALALLVGGLALAAPGLGRLLETELGRRWPSEDGRLRAGLAGLAAVTALVLAHHAFGPVHEVELAGVAALGALGATTLALRMTVRLARPRDAAGVVGAAALVTVLGTFAPWGREDARFVLFNQSSAASLAEALRDLSDADGDGAAGRFLGGADCNDGDRSIGPVLREIPGDGVDQDCRGGDASPPSPLPAASLPDDCAPREAPLSVLFLVVDALRNDAVIAGAMPTVTTLGSEGWVFERAYAPTAMTVTSVSSIFTARPLSDVGAPNPQLDGALGAPFTLAERFGAKGHRTAAFSDFLDFPIAHRGFATINPHWRDLPVAGVKATLTSASTSRGILDHLTGSAEPAFVWAHFSDTHARYKLDRDKHGRPLGEREAYLRGAAYVDRQLATLLAGLAARGRADDTVVVLSADHGEELLDHGKQGHGANLFEESIRVPLIVRVPGCPPRRMAEPVVSTGVGPTLGALLGVDIPGRGLFDQGGSPVIVEGPTGLDTHFKRAVIGPRHKLIVDVANGGAMLFDLEADPAETTAIDDDAARAPLEAAYQRWLDAPGAR